MSTISVAGSVNREGTTMDTLLREMAQFQVRHAISGAFAAITDSSGGTASGTRTIAGVANVANSPNAATNLADKTTAEAALGTVINGVRELFDRANAIQANLVTGSGAPIPAITYNGGGTAPNGTIEAVTVAVTAAATGIQATQTNAAIAALNSAFYVLGNLVNHLCVAAGRPVLVLGSNLSGWSTTIAAIPTNLGTAADPGVTKAAFDAALAQYRANIATIAARLNDLRNTSQPPVVAVP